MVVGTSGDTNVPGLFAAGEVTAGVDGANRVGGNALTNCLVFGSRAGLAVASYLSGSPSGHGALNGLRVPGNNTIFTGGIGDDRALSVDEKPHVTTGFMAPEPFRKLSLSMDLPPQWDAQKWLAAWRDGLIRPESLRKELRHLASLYLLPVRDEAGLFTCIETLSRLAESLARQSVKDSRDILLAFENLGLWYTGAFVALGAIMRRESRGPHFRIDYPEELEQWKRHILIQKTGEKIVAEIS